MKELLKFSERVLASILSEKAIIHEFEINCDTIRSQKFIFSERHQGHLGPLFQQLDAMITPCIYWFEAEDIPTALRFKEDLEKYRHDHKRRGRNIPVGNANRDSKVIYVGKRNGGLTKKTGLSHIGSRIYIHLGFYHVGSTQGLQLAHWANGQLKLRVVALPVTAKPYLAILEKLLAIELNPLCGKH